MDPEQIPLRDLHLPEAVGWWPLAPGWWVLLGLLAVVAALLARRAWIRWRFNAPRRTALRELERLENTWRAGAKPVALATGLSELVRRTMLAYSPRREVAGLTGREWLAWLDRGLEDKLFSEGPGRSLEELPYRRTETEVPAREMEALIAAVRRRLTTPLPETR